MAAAQHHVKTVLPVEESRNVDCRRHLFIFGSYLNCRRLFFFCVVGGPCVKATRQDSGHARVGKHRDEHPEEVAEKVEQAADVAHVREQVVSFSIRNFLLVGDVDLEADEFVTLGEHHPRARLFFADV
jgi:hypothetical protein